MLWILSPKFSGKVVAKFCAKFLHQQMLKSEAYLAGDIGTSLQKAFLRLEENRKHHLYSILNGSCSSYILQLNDELVLCLQGIEFL